MTTINTNYNSYPNMANYLGGTNNAQTNTNSSSPPSLVTLLGNDSSDDNSNDLLNFFEQNSNFRNYNLPVDGNGKAFMPTIDQMNAASTPDSKLTLTSYVAQTVLMQSDASTKTSNAARISDITNQAQSVLQALASAATDITGQDGSQTLSADQQKTTSTTLNAINTSLSQVVNLLSKADPATRTSLQSQLSDLDTLAFNIAGLTGTSWTSVTGNSNNTIAGYSAATASTQPSGTTSGYLNITV